MCGIFGAIAALDTATLDRVSQSLAHRGPDAEGRHTDGEISLLHRRLAVIDLTSAGAQPMTNEDATVWLTFNGEIYNHAALRTQLEALGHTFVSRSDTEVIIHGFETWGAAVVDRLDGMFAFLIWDQKTKTLLAARDRTGKKPLYYSERGGCFRAASSIAALTASGIQAAPSKEHLPYLLAYGFVPAPHTIYEGVKQLAPGTSLLRTADGAINIRTYFRPEFVSSRNADSYQSATKRVRELVEAAVERRLESDVPLGAFLSGGIDSTIIVGTMARLTGRPVKTFSIGFAGDARYDETNYARIAARAFKTDHTEFTLEPSSFDLVEKLVAHHDGPFGDSSAIPTSVVARLTREHVTVALTGDGGDELFCGYERFLAAELAERIPTPLRAFGGAIARRWPRASSQRSLLRKAGLFFEVTSLPLADRMARLNAFFFDPRQILDHDFAAQLGERIDDPLAWQRQIFANMPKASPLKHILHHNFVTYLPYDLLVKADRCTMAHGLEVRSPLLDTALIDYVSQLPDAYLRRGTTTKRILRDAFSDIIPREIMTRSKMGFGVPLGTWFRGNLQGYLHDRLGSASPIYNYLDRSAVQRLLDEHQQSRADHGQKLWLLITLDTWLRQLAS